MKHEPGMAYDTKKLNKIFAILSVIFLLSVVWMMFDDFIRPWKAYQIKAMDIKKQMLSKQLEEINKELDPKIVAELKLKVENAEEIVEKNKSQIKKLEDELSEVEGELYREKMHNGGLNALITETTFKYEVALDKGRPEAPKLKKQLDELNVQFKESKENLKQLQVKQAEIKKKIAESKSELNEANKELEKVIGQQERLYGSLQKAKWDPVTLLRNLPFIDFLDPTLKVQQVVLDNVTDDRFFQNVPKVDRCMTCHTFIDQPGFEKQENPFKTHPNLDLMVGMNSPHPLKSYGCTTCHGGEGHRVTDFQSIAHTPKNEEQAQLWREKYHWHEPHKIQQPMLKLTHTEASCVKCHQGVEIIPGATVLNDGRTEIKENGCYACHKIEGWEHLPKPGPSLAKVASKLDKNWVKNWIWSPTSFNKHAKMPSFFNLSNNDAPEFRSKNMAEVNTIAEYLWEKSKDYRPHQAYTGGDADKGKEIIQEIGCLGCHQVEGVDEQYQKSKNKRGPYLTALGSKLDQDWLVSWLMRPHSYDPDTIMPSFRLTLEEANDVAAFLLGQKNEAFKEKEFIELNKDVRDELLLEYLMAFETEESAKKKLAQMSDHEKTIDLGQRSIGKYGCFSCHNIDGFDGRAPIGPELTNVGSKPVEQFGFGHEHIPHSRDSWIHHHLQNPRRWDKGVPKPFKDLLRMPKFNLSQKEIQSMVVALLGQVNEKVPLKGVKRLTPEEAIAEKGFKVVSEMNCMGCHQIDGLGGEILKNYADDPNEGPPLLVKQGHRVQADWFHHFLDNVTPLRPWLKIRMPSFQLTNEERNKIVTYFQSKASQVTFEAEESKLSWEPGEREAAIDLFKKLDCASCHTAGFSNDLATAPDLRKAGRRLRSSWIEKWLKNPQAIIPSTPMPAFWENGQSPEPTILGGDSDRQIKALTKYIMELGSK